MALKLIDMDDREGFEVVMDEGAGKPQTPIRTIIALECQDGFFRALDRYHLGRDEPPEVIARDRTIEEVLNTAYHEIKRLYADNSLFVDETSRGKTQAAEQLPYKSQ